MAFEVRWEYPTKKHVYERVLFFHERTNADEWARHMKKHGWKGVRVVPVRASQRARAHSRRIR